MKIVEVQKSYNLKFANKNPSKVKKAIVKVSQETISRIEKQVRKSKREQIHYKFERLQLEKDIRYKNILG